MAAAHGSAGGRGMKTLSVGLALLLAAAVSPAAWAQGVRGQDGQGAQGRGVPGQATQGLTAQDGPPPMVHFSRDGWRGGWETTVNGSERILELRIRGDVVSGVSCTACDDPSTLSFVDGRLGSGGLTLTLTHVRNDGSTLYQDHLKGRMQGGHLIITGSSGAPGGGDFTWTMHRDPRGLPPPAVPPARRPPPPHYLQPGPWETITADKLVGVWLAGSGPNKQYFIIKRVGNTLRGVACGPCDNTYTMGALEDFFIQGDTVLWDICHEDWGFGQLPYPHQVLAHLSQHELRMDVQQPNMRRVVSMTLYGPLPYAAVIRSAAGSSTDPGAVTTASGGAQ
jgi:hypothetical protein